MAVDSDANASLLFMCTAKSGQVWVLALLRGITYATARQANECMEVCKEMRKSSKSRKFRSYSSSKAKSSSGLSNHGPCQEGNPLLKSRTLSARCRLKFIAQAKT